MLVVHLALLALCNIGAARAAGLEAPDTWEPAAAIEVVLSNGLRVWVVASPDAERPDLDIVIREPPAAEPRRFAGLAWMAHALVWFPGENAIHDAGRKDVVHTPSLRTGWTERVFSY